MEQVQFKFKKFNKWLKWINIKLSCWINEVGNLNKGSINFAGIKLPVNV